MGALRILKLRAGTLIALGIVAFGGLLTSPCLIGIPVLVGMLVSIAGTTLDAGCTLRDLPVQRTPGRGTWVAALALFAFLTTTLLSGLAAVESLRSLLPPDSEALVRVVFVAAGVLVAICLSPLAFLPFAALDEGVSFASAAFLSAHVAAKRGPVRHAVTVALSTLALLSPVLLDAALLPVRDHAVFVWGAALAVTTVVGFPLSLAILAGAYLDASPREQDLARSTTTTTPASGARFLLAATAALSTATLVAIVAAALVPLPMTPISDPSWLPHRPPDVMLAGGRTLPRTRISGTALTVRGLDDGIVVSADDGGGVGTVRTRAIGKPTALWIRRTARNRHAPMHLVAINAGMSGPDDIAELHRARVVESVVIDSNGVRIDDGVGERWTARIDVFGGTLLGAAALLALLALWRVGGLLAAARHLGHPFGPTDPRTSVIAALDGKLRLGRGATLWITPARFPFRRASVELRGDAWLESADGHLRLRIPPGFSPALAHDPESRPLADGDVIAAVGRLGRIGAGARDAEIEWPARAAFVAGDHERAAVALRARAMRTWAAVAALLLLDLSAVILWIVLRFYRFVCRRTGPGIDRFEAPLYTGASDGV